MNTEDKRKLQINLLSLNNSYYEETIMKVQPTKYNGSVNLLRDSFLELSEFLKTKLKFEKRANQSNFDSGIPIEDYFRQEFQKLIPPKYSLTCGSVIDKNHNTCGDCDVVFYDSFSYPKLKSSTTEDSRRKFMPFESVFGIIELKQTLNTGALDSTGNLKEGAKTNLITACEKIAQFKGLHRKQVNDDFIKPGMVVRGQQNVNRPFGFILCLDGPDDAESVRKEVRRINEEIPKERRIDGLFVLNKYAFTWLLGNPLKKSSIKETTPEFATGNAIVPSGKDTLYYLFISIWNTIKNQKLNAPDYFNDYGGKENLTHDIKMFFPSQREV